MPRGTNNEIEKDDDDDKQQNETFLFREPIVLLTIMWLSLSNGITLAVQHTRVIEAIRDSDLFDLWQMSFALMTLGTIFFAFLSEIHGRKPILISLYALSIFSSILHSLPWIKVMMVSLPLQSVLRGGCSVMTTLAISEYCRPKHRFAYMLTNVAATASISYAIAHMFFSIELFKAYPCLQAFQIVLGLVCLVSTRKWVESPYWLACKGRLEESRDAFLWLRGDEGRQELASVMETRRSPGPPLFYWKSLFIAVTTISVALFVNLEHQFWEKWTNFYLRKSMVQAVIRLCGNSAVIFVIAVTSYFVKRKNMFLAVSGVSVALSLAVAIWVFVDPYVKEPDNDLFYAVSLTCDLIRRNGPAMVASVLFIESLPQKYNTHLTCVAVVYSTVSHYSYMKLVSKEALLDVNATNAHIPVLALLSLGGVIIYYFVAPETKDKTLLEIQKLCTPELSEANSFDHEMTDCCYGISKCVV